MRAVTWLLECVEWVFGLLRSGAVLRTFRRGRKLRPRLESESRLSTRLQSVGRESTRDTQSLYGTIRIVVACTHGSTCTPVNAVFELATAVQKNW